MAQFSMNNLPINPFTNKPIPMGVNSRAFVGGRSLLDNIYGASNNPSIQANPPSNFRRSMMGNYGLMNDKFVRRNPTSLDTSQFVDPNINNPYLRNNLTIPEPVNEDELLKKIPENLRQYAKIVNGQVVFDMPEELEMGTQNQIEKVPSNIPNFNTEEEYLKASGLLNQQGNKKNNKGLLNNSEEKPNEEKPKMSMQGLLDKAVQFATSDFGRDFFMGMDTGYSKEPKSFMESIQGGYNYAKQNELAREKLDIDRLKANKMGGDQNFAYIVTDPNTGNKYNAFVDSKNGRVLVNVDGEKKEWKPNMFGGEVPAEISTVSNLGKADLTGNVFIKEKRQLTTYENQLKKLSRFMENVDNGPVGMEKLATQWSSYIKTILNSNEGLTPQELRQKALEGDFQGLIGANRLEIVGGGVMTEQDAIRIITAIGGDPADIETNPEAVITQISKIFGEKYNLYKDALETYNINVVSGGFGAYPKKDEITFNDNFLNVLSPDTALELDLALLPDFSKTQLLRLLDLNTNAEGLVIDDAFTEIQKEQIIALAKTFELELDFDEEIE